MKWLTFTAAMTLALTSTLASASDPKPYYDQLFAGDRLDITVALGFEQKKGAPDLPAVITILADAAKAPYRDNENTQRDVNLLEEAILGCSDCGYTKGRVLPGQRIYNGNFQYGKRTIQTRLQLIFSEPGVTIAGLRKSFIWALGNDAVVVYLGHSRHGDGFPDFAGPLADAGKVFVNDTVQGWTGFEKGYFARKKYQLLVLNACQTERYFKQALRTRVWEKDPSLLGLIMSSDDTWFEDYPDTMSALLNGLVHQQSREDLLQSLDDAANYYHSVHQLDATKRLLFNGDGLLDATYAKKPAPKAKQPAEPWMDMPF